MMGRETLLKGSGSNNNNKTTDLAQWGAKKLFLPQLYIQIITTHFHVKWCVQVFEIEAILLHSIASLVQA